MLREFRDTEYIGFRAYDGVQGLGGTPHPVIVTIRDAGDHVQALTCSYLSLLQGDPPKV